MRPTRIGYWRSSSEPKLPNPQDLVVEIMDTAEKKRVLAHLSCQQHINHAKGMSTCRICGKLNGSAEQTDGKYIWPTGLAHYVEEHNVRLPQEFVDHVSGFGDCYVLMRDGQQVPGDSDYEVLGVYVDKTEAEQVAKNKAKVDKYDRFFVVPATLND